MQETKVDAILFFRASFNTDLGLFKRAFVPESSRTSPVSPEPSDDTWLYKQSSQIRQLEDKLSTYRGLVLGWKHRCDVAEDALEKRIEDRECVGNNVQMLEAKLECIQELLRSQNAHFRQREDRFEWMSSLALLMSCLSIGFILIRLSDK